MADVTRALPLCRSLQDGRYPSHVCELRATRYPIGMYEAGLQENRSAFGHGGFVLMDELAAGVTYRASRRQDLSGESVLVRVLAPVGGWISADMLDHLADAADQLGEGLVHMTMGGTIEIYVTRERVLDLVAFLNDRGLDVGSTGDDLRGLTACCGPARCDCAVVDSTGLATYLGRRFIDEQQFPGFPHKCKTGVAGCTNDCIRATTQRDHSFVGVYRDLPIIDQARLAEWVRQGGSAEGLCRLGAISMADGEAAIHPEKCVRCMSCSTHCPAIRPGRDRGVAWVAGGKFGSRGHGGPMAGHVLVPFIPIEGDDFGPVGDLYERFLTVWSDHGLPKERIGDFLLRFGTGPLLREMGLNPAEPSSEGRCEHGAAVPRRPYA